MFLKWTCALEIERQMKKEIRPKKYRETREFVKLTCLSNTILGPYNAIVKINLFVSSCMLLWCVIAVGNWIPI